METELLREIELNKSEKCDEQRTPDFKSSFSGFPLKDYEVIQDDFRNRILSKVSEYEFLLNNNLIEPSMIIRIKHNINKLNLLFEEVKYRFLLIGAFNSGKTSFLNAMIGYDLLNHSNHPTTQIILIIRPTDCDKPQLYKAKFDYKNHVFKFVEDRIISEGYEDVRESLVKLDTQTHINSATKFEDYEAMFYILKVKIWHLNKMIKNKGLIQSKIEFIDLPGIGDFESNKIIQIITKYLEFDDEIFDKLEELSFQRSLENLAIHMKLTKEEEKKEFWNFKPIRRNYCLFFMSIENISINLNIDIAKLIMNYSKSFINISVILNKIDQVDKIKIRNLISNLIKNIRDNNEVSQELKESEIENLNLIMEEISKNKSNDALKNFFINFIEIKYNFFKKKKFLVSAKNTLSYRILSQSDTELTRNYSMNLYQSSSELQEVFDDYEEFYFQFQKNIKKYVSFEKEFQFCEEYLLNSIVNIILYEINNTYSAGNTLNLLINDVLTINNFNYDKFNISNKNDIAIFISSFQNFLTIEIEQFNKNMDNYFNEFLDYIFQLITKEKEKINEWEKSIVFYSSVKINCLYKLFDELINQINKQIDNYMLETSERIIFFLIKLRKGIEDLGFLNEFIINYLSNIELSVNQRITIFKSEQNDSTLNNLGFGVGVGLIGGILGWSVIRAVAQSVAGPVGMLIGVATSVGTIVTKTVLTHYKNKNLLKEGKNNNYKHLDSFLHKINDQLRIFHQQNSLDVQSRILKMLSYIEFSLEILVRNKSNL